MKMNANLHILIFSINSGRAGSNYLAKLLGTAREVISFHEAEPNMAGKYLHKLHGCSYEETFDERKIKIVSNITQPLSSNPLTCF